MKSVLRSKVKFAVVCPLLLRHLGETPGWGLGKNQTTMLLMPPLFLTPSGLPQLEGGRGDRSPGQKEEASANFLRGGGTGGGGAEGGGRRGCPGLRIPRLEAEPGGARPGRPLFLAAPRCSAGRGHSRLRELGARSPADPELP